LLRCSQQIAAAFLMESRVVWFGLDDVCGISRQPGKLVNHHIRRGGRDRIAYCLAVEGIGVEAEAPISRSRSTPGRRVSCP
jgi:hypothetical protein